jgi:Ca2+-binding RTX toxin-like protein
MNPFVQQLENRQFLSATLADGVLDVVGTKANNNVTVSLSDDGATITVSESIARKRGRTSAATTTEFAAADVTSIVIDAGAGNDKVVFRALGDADFATPATVMGGNGNDWLSTGGGADSIDGGLGDDRINAGDGADSANGGDGDDRIDGGAGADLLNGDDGDDYLVGGDDADTMNGGDGDDTFDAAGDGAVDTIDGGADSAAADEDDQDTAAVDASDTTTDVVTNATIGDESDLFGGHGDCGPGGGGGGGGHGHDGGGGGAGFSTRRIHQ